MNNTVAAADREPLAGLVERVTYHNPDNGYCVLRVKVRGHRDLVTVLGHAASISAGEFVQASSAAFHKWASSWSSDNTVMCLPLVSGVIEVIMYQKKYASQPTEMLYLTEALYS